MNIFLIWLIGVFVMIAITLIYGYFFPKELKKLITDKEYDQETSDTPLSSLLVVILLWPISVVIISVAGIIYGAYYGFRFLLDLYTDCILKHKTKEN